MFREGDAVLRDFMPKHNFTALVKAKDQLSDTPQDVQTDKYESRN